MKAVLMLCQTEFRLSLRNPIYLFFAFAFPPMMLLLFGGMYGNDPSPFYDGRGAVDALTPAYIGMVVGICGLMGLPLQLAEYRQRKVLKRYRATPVGRAAIMTPHFAVNAALCVIGIALLLVVGAAVFGLHFFGNGFYFILMLLLSMACIFSIGFLIAAVAPGSGAATTISYLVYFPMLFLSGATIPLQIMPDSIQKISEFIPLTHCVNVLQGAWLGRAPAGDLNSVLILAIISVVCFALSIRFFRWEA